MKKIQSNWIKMLLLGAFLILFYRVTENYKGSLDWIGDFIGVFTPCIIGVVIAFFLWKPAEKLEVLIGKAKWNFLRSHKKAVSILSIYLIIVIIMALAVNFILPVLSKNVKDLAINAPSYIDKADRFLKENKYLSEIDIFETMNGKLESFVKENLTLSNINKYISVLGNIAGSFLNFFLGIIFSIYILFDREGIKKFWKTVGDKFLSGKGGIVLRKYIAKTVGLFYSYFSGLAIDALIVGFVTSVALGIFRVPYAVLLGVLAAIGNMVPFFGPIVATVVTFIISMLTVGPVNALWIIAFQIILGQVDSNIIQPKILSKSTGVSPLLVLFAVIVFGELFGFFGMVLGVPLIATIKMIADDYFDNGKLDGSMPEDITKKGNDINE
ncbi:MAG: AI-2E family transporter [Clostridia bacterium]|nr:AI-2E family transporter [Clostridia bacterium]